MMQYLAYLHWMSAIKSEWVSAISSAIAAVISASAIWFTVMAPKRERQLARSHTTHEILITTLHAVRLFEKSKYISISSKYSFVAQAAEAKMLLKTLEVLISRPDLTDGAIATASGSIAIMIAIIDQLNVYSGNDARNNLVRNNTLDKIDNVVILTKVRAKHVIDYVCRESWPSWKKNFQDDSRIQELREIGVIAEGQL